MVSQLRADIESRDARIADLEMQIGRMHKVVAEGEEALARIRIELREANLQKSTIEVRTGTVLVLLIRANVSSCPNVLELISTFYNIN